MSLETTGSKAASKTASMSAKGGKLVWVRDPALVDDEVFIKGKVISENEKQVSVDQSTNVQDL